MVINKKFFIIFLLLVGAVIGTGLIWGYENYKDDVLDFVNVKNDDESEENEFDTPYFVGESWDFGFAEEDSKKTVWSFYIFQPIVAEYKTVNGLNYIVGEYRNGDTEADEKFKVDILISRDEEWSLEKEGLDQESFEVVISLDTKFQRSYNSSLKNFSDTSSLDLNQIKEKFPLGKRIAIAVPLYYPTAEDRSEANCSIAVDICDYARVWDVLSAQLELFSGGEAIDEDFALVPYSVSGDIYKWSEEGQVEKKILKTRAD